MDVVRLRNVISCSITALKNSVGHVDIPQFCRKFTLVEPTVEQWGSKRERLDAAVANTPDIALVGVAERLLAENVLRARDRNVIQDLIWPSGPPIPKRFRHDIARRLDIEDLFIDARNFDALLDRLFILTPDEFDMFGILDARDRSLKDQITRHVHNNRGDWTVEELFDRLGAFETTDRRFANLLEGLISADILPDIQRQHSFAAIVNEVLAGCNLELRETGESDGYPLYTLMPKDSAPQSRPKNLIFASPVKPDLRFRDAINNDIEIVSNADKVLVYDLAISTHGLRWCELQSWWKERNHIETDDEAKDTLYRRLLGALPASSPPQKLFFEAYHRAFRQNIQQLPALLPEVWLHWDPQTVKERGVNALIRSRMDFLMLLPNGYRVVMEIDGKQHYSTSEKADPQKYAVMASADRDLRLRGYQVFRFGGAELHEETGPHVVKSFFDLMFVRFGVTI